MRRTLILLLVTIASLLSGVLPATAMPDLSPTADPAPLQSYAAPSFAAGAGPTSGSVEAMKAGAGNT